MSTRRCHQPRGSIPIRDIVVIRDRIAARGDDLGHHRVSGGGVAALPAQRGADVVDDDVRAFGGKGQRVGAPQPARCAGNDDGAVVAEAHAHSLSMIVTLACPPPSHIVCRP